MDAYYTLSQRVASSSDDDDDDFASSGFLHSFSLKESDFPGIDFNKSFNYVKGANSSDELMRAIAQCELLTKTSNHERKQINLARLIHAIAQRFIASKTRGKKGLLRLPGPVKSAIADKIQSYVLDFLNCRLNGPLISQSCSIILWAIAKLLELDLRTILNFPPDQIAMLFHFLAFSEDSKPVSPQSLSNGLWAIAKLFELGKQDLAQHVMTRDIIILFETVAIEKTGNSQDYSNALWAVVKLIQCKFPLPIEQINPVFVLEIYNRLIKMEDDSQSFLEHCVLILWSIAKLWDLGLDSIIEHVTSRHISHLFSRISAFKKMEEMKPQCLFSILWFSVKFLEKGMIGIVEDNIKPQQMANIFNYLPQAKGVKLKELAGSFLLIISLLKLGIEVEKFIQRQAIMAVYSQVISLRARTHYENDIHACLSGVPVLIACGMGNFQRSELETVFLSMRDDIRNTLLHTITLLHSLIMLNYLGHIQKSFTLGSFSKLFSRLILFLDMPNPFDEDRRSIFCKLRDAVMDHALEIKSIPEFLNGLPVDSLIFIHEIYSYFADAENSTPENSIFENSIPTNITPDLFEKMLFLSEFLKKYHFRIHNNILCASQMKFLSYLLIELKNYGFSMIKQKEIARVLYFNDWENEYTFTRKENTDSAEQMVSFVVGPVVDGKSFFLKIVLTNHEKIRAGTAVLPDRRTLFVNFNDVSRDHVYQNFKTNFQSALFKKSNPQAELFQLHSSGFASSSLSVLHEITKNIRQFFGDACYLDVSYL